MAVTPSFTIGAIRKRFEAFLAEIEKKKISRLQMLGEMCVSHARRVPKGQGFEDQTGALRSSIGYMIFKDGVAIRGEYEVVTGVNKEGKPMTGGADGAKAGEALARRVGERTKGLALVVTAGMNYATHVESRGRDVITSAEQLCERELPRMIDELKDSIKKATE